MAKEKPSREDIVVNRKARFDYTILENFEAGIVLTGSEVKSLRAGKVAVVDSFAQVDNDEVWLLHLNIATYKQAGARNHEPTRPRKLLMNKAQINKIIGATTKKGLTVVPLALYFNKKGLVKVDIGIAKGKAAHDKRESTKTRDWQRQKSRIMKGDV